MFKQSKKMTIWKKKKRLEKLKLPRVEGNGLRLWKTTKNLSLEILS